MELDRRQASTLLKLETDMGLPLIANFTLFAAPQAPSLNRFRAKLPLALCRSKNALFDKELVAMPAKSATHFYTFLRGDKKRFMPVPQVGLGIHTESSSLPDVG